MDTYSDELAFESDLVAYLKDSCGWSTESWAGSGQDMNYRPRPLLKNPDERALIENWRRILFENNRRQDCLNEHPLTDTEMEQVIERVRGKNGPVDLNALLMGGELGIIRDNKDDPAHLGKEVLLRIFERDDAGGGKSVYQIVEQPRFDLGANRLNERRGDVMLLINGLPLFHVEIKRSRVPIRNALSQLENYRKWGLYSHPIFSFIQVLVAMTPENTLYLANPGAQPIREELAFCFEDKNGSPVNSWKAVCRNHLFIPAAHQLIGEYTVGQKASNRLIVMRSYQINACAAITDRVFQRCKNGWEDGEREGGYCWQTTGSGKTLTSFKAAQRIRSLRDGKGRPYVDKVLFVADRIALTTQTAEEYDGFARPEDIVATTENTAELRDQLLSKSGQETVVVTSIQKLGKLAREDDPVLKDKLRKKRIVLIFDECHRSAYGEWMSDIKAFLPMGMFFGFTGTPRFDDGSGDITTATVFGSELATARYTIADGIRDGNVLRFHVVYESCPEPDNMREIVAGRMAKAHSREDAWEDPNRKREFLYWRDADLLTIEKNFPSDLLRSDERLSEVAAHVLKDWQLRAVDDRLQALFATSSIDEAIRCWRMMKGNPQGYRVFPLFDASVDAVGDSSFDRQAAIEEIMDSYEQAFGKKLASPEAYKDDLVARFRHVKPYVGVNRKNKDNIDIVIVVDQLLTGFDSAHLAVLYLDKVLDGAALIQAFSRTNRILDMHVKEHGTIVCYRKAETMKKNTEEAVKLYSGDREPDLFIPELKDNVREMNRLYAQMAELFPANEEGEPDFSATPKDYSAKREFVEIYNQFQALLDRSRLQGFTIKEELSEYEEAAFPEEKPSFNANAVTALANRYVEISYAQAKNIETREEDEPPLDIDFGIAETGILDIDENYLNRKFQRYLIALQQGVDVEKFMKEFVSEFQRLPREDQGFAMIVRHKAEVGEIRIEEGLTFRNCLERVKKEALDQKVRHLVDSLGIPDTDLLMTLRASEYGSKDRRFGELCDSIDKSPEGKAGKFLSELRGEKLSRFAIGREIRKILSEFVDHGVDITVPAE